MLGVLLALKLYDDDQEEKYPAMNAAIILTEGFIVLLFGIYELTKNRKKASLVKKALILNWFTS